MYEMKSQVSNHLSCFQFANRKKIEWNWEKMTRARAEMMPPNEIGKRAATPEACCECEMNCVTVTPRNPESNNEQTPCCQPFFGLYPFVILFKLKPFFRVLFAFFPHPPWLIHTEEEEIAVFGTLGMTLIPFSLPWTLGLPIAFLTNCSGESDKNAPFEIKKKTNWDIKNEKFIYISLFRIFQCLFHEFIRSLS